jgi:hypothetical protein
MISRRMRHAAGGAVVLVLVAGAACSDPTGPVQHVSPWLRTFWLDYSTLRHGGFLTIEAVPQNPEFRLGANQRVPVEVTVSSGDRETVELYRMTCPDRERGWKYNCFRFLVWMHEGHVAHDLEEHVAAIGGRMWVMGSSGRLAAIVVFEPGVVLRHAMDARSWPGVQLVETSLPVCNHAVEHGPHSCPPNISLLSRPLPVDTGAAVPGDGIVQVRSGDVIVVSHRQPSGAMLRDSIGVP